MRQSRQGRAPSRPAQSVIALRRVHVVRTYLALDDPSRFSPGRTTDATRHARLVRHSPCPVDRYRQLYKEVGERWYWHDRLELSDEELGAYLARPDVGVWEVFDERGESAGYFELKRSDDGSVEIAYFGLRPAFIGRGLGGWMLGRAVDEARAMEASRVWLHTCTLDSEHALPNYLARGFLPFRTERLEVDIEGDQVVAERMLDD